MDSYDLCVSPHGDTHSAAFVLGVIGVRQERLHAALELLKHRAHLCVDVIAMHGSIRSEGQVLVSEGMSAKLARVVSHPVEPPAVHRAKGIDRDRPQLSTMAVDRDLE